MSSKSPLYCQDRSCATFIDTSDLEDSQAICSRCGAPTCIFCKKEYHSGECAKTPNDAPEDDSLVAMALDQKWQRCNSCSRYVEQSSGCNHITYVHLLHSEPPGLY